MKVLESKREKFAPKYQRLAAQLRLQIEGGQLKPSDQLPAFSEMREQHGVSQVTLQRAYGILEQDGLVVRQQGRGTFVAEFRGTNAAAQNNGWLQNSIAVLTRHRHDSLSAASQNPGLLAWITRGVLAGIEESGHHLLLLHPDRFEQKAQQLAQAHPYGLIVTDLAEHPTHIGELVSALNRERVPIACYGGAPELASYDRVTSDHETGSYEITRWLLQQNRKRIVMMATRPRLHDDYWMRQRRAGYERALNEAGLQPAPTLEVPGFDGELKDRADFEARVHQLVVPLVSLLTGPAPPDAFLFNSDAYAFYAAAALRLFHRKPNEDVALAGYDNYWADSPEREFEAVGPLITADKRNAEVGALLVQLLQQRAQGELPAEPQVCVLKPRIIVNDEAR